MTTIQG